MTTEVNFYHLTQSSLDDALPRLLAKTLQAMGKAEEARHWARLAAELPYATKDDVEARKEAAKMAGIEA